MTLNATAVAPVQAWLQISDLKPEDYLFIRQRDCLTVETMSTRVKTWCQDVGVKGHYGSHTLRKTWGYWQRLERGTAIPLLKLSQLAQLLKRWFGLAIARRAVVKYRKLAGIAGLFQRKSNKPKIG